MKQRPRQKLKRLGVALIGLLLHASSVQFFSDDDGNDGNDDGDDDDDDDHIA